MKSLVPIRADLSVQLTAAEKDCIAWFVLSGCSRSEAFAIFCRPELKDARVVLEKLSSQFFASSPVIDYMEAYKNTLEQALHPTPATPSTPADRTYSATEMKMRKEQALQKLMNYVIEQANNIDDLEDKEDIIKFADKLGLLGNEEESVEAPRRYLPETCANCRYKEFVEANCEEI